MSNLTPSQEAFGRKSRLVGLVLAGTMLVWLGVQWLGPRVGMGLRYAVLFDLLALASFVWALIVTYQLWRVRREE